MNKVNIEFVVRVKLPSSAGFSSGPSGDTEYESAYQKAIFDIKPDGFEVAWASRGAWPVDRDGMTWVKLYCTDTQNAIAFFRDRMNLYQKRLSSIHELALQISECST